MRSMRPGVKRGGVLLAIMIVAVIVFLRPFGNQPEPNPGLGTVRIGLIDCFDSEHLPETSAYYMFLGEYAEDEVNRFCEDEGIDIRFEVDFYPVEEFEDTLEAVRDCWENGTRLLVGFPNNAALSLGMSHRYGELVIVSIGSSQPSGMNLDDTVFRLHPNRHHKLGPLARMMYEGGVRTVLPLRDFTDGVDEFIEEFTALRGTALDEFTYSWHKENEAYVMDFDVERFSGLVTELVSREPRGSVAVLYFGQDEISQILDRSLEYPNVTSVQWFSYESSWYWREMEGLRPALSDIRLLSLEANVSDNEGFRRVNSEFKEEFGRGMSLVEANIVDGVWVLALSVIEERSLDVDLLKERVPVVGSEYLGVTGRCLLDGYGDRDSIDYVVWGFSELNGEAVITNFGRYDFEKDSFVWI
ncbi:hypothetical protein JXL21_04480 [Candidatus Bathyarchaeota archaeon]|nr:hypothetical protein [Candidatus Bathyarchaeota archaeon]